MQIHLKAIEGDNEKLAIDFKQVGGSKFYYYTMSKRLANNINYLDDAVLA
jgi:hypothetical protein